MLPARLASELVRDLAQQLPDVTVALQRIKWTVPVAARHDGRADLCLLRPPIDQADLPTGLRWTSYRADDGLTFINM